jgi:hypothetical protein
MEPATCNLQLYKIRLVPETKAGFDSLVICVLKA